MEMVSHHEEDLHLNEHCHMRSLHVQSYITLTIQQTAVGSSSLTSSGQCERNALTMYHTTATTA